LVPDVSYIYDHYIKPTGSREVNISGKLQSAVMASFSDNMQSIEPRRDISEEGCIFNNSSPQRINDQSVIFENISSSPEVFVTSEQKSSFISDNVSDKENTKVAVYDKMLQRLIELYPVWKALVNLLTNDTLIRYRQLVAKNGGVEIHV